VAVSLLGDIQNAAADDAMSLSSVLRKCQILAARLKYEPLKVWVGHELNGYPPRSDLPDYRVMRGVVSRGDFIGPQGQLSNAPIPETVVPDPTVQEMMTTMKMWDGVGTYEAMLREASQAPGGGIKNPWPTGAQQMMAGSIYRGMNCVEAWQELPASSLAGMLDQIRNRVLAFTLEIEEANPQLGEPAVSPSPKEQAQVGHTFNTTILGGQATIVAGGTVNQQTVIAQGDLGELLAKVRELGVPPAEAEALAVAIEEDASAGETFGAKPRHWLDGAQKKVQAGAWKVGTTAATEVIAALIKQHLGIP